MDKNQNNYNFHKVDFHSDTTIPTNMDFGKPILLIMCFVWIRVIYFYFVFVEDQSFKAHAQSMWNSHIPATSRKLLCNPSLFLDHSLLLCFDQTRSSANNNDKVGPLFSCSYFLLFCLFILIIKITRQHLGFKCFPLQIECKTLKYYPLKTKRGMMQ